MSDARPRSATLFASECPRSKFFGPLRHLVAMLLLCAVPGAAGSASVSAVAPDMLKPGGYKWLSTGPWDGPLYMVVSIRHQQVHVYSGDMLVGMAAVSTGMTGHRTPTGDYPILQKRQWHRSNLYSNAPMPFMQRLTWDGIALHAGHNPGYPASHGCIRLPYAFAQKLFALTRMGTLVTVSPDRLSPMLALDPLVVSDASSAVVGFTPRFEPFPGPPPRDIPRLEIDPAIFGTWGRR
ncbi:L,D-transpeptidase family protein [Sphingobium sp. AN641]|uniref:L,D-transpeptidase family protein n=2 Tax=Sphingobium sp. AN641 TaxID=3133443 RepID=UPI0030C3C950